MIRSAVSKVMWVGRATVFLVGLAVILALVLGVASTALGKNGQSVILGKAANTATKVTGLIGKVATGSALVVKNPSGGSALGLEVNAGQAPLTVNAGAGKATNLDADKLDGKEASEFLGKTEKATDAAHADQADSATNADTVDGKHAADFYASGSKVADSDQLDGLDSTGFIQGKGNIYHRRVSMPLGTLQGDIVDVPDFGKIIGRCYGSNPTSYSIEWVNTSGQVQEAWWFNKDGVGYDVITTNRAVSLVPFLSTTDYVVVLQVGRQGRTATITVAGHPSSTGCNFSVQAVSQID